MGQVGKVIGKVKYGSPCFLVPLFLQTASLRYPNWAFLLHCCAHLRCGAGGDSSAAQMSGVRSQKRSAACGTAEVAGGAAAGYRSLKYGSGAAVPCPPVTAGWFAPAATH